MRSIPDIRRFGYSFKFDPCIFKNSGEDAGTASRTIERKDRRKEEKIMAIRTIREIGEEILTKTSKPVSKLTLQPRC